MIVKYPDKPITMKSISVRRTRKLELGKSFGGMLPEGIMSGILPFDKYDEWIVLTNLLSDPRTTSAVIRRTFDPMFEPEYEKLML